MPAGWNGRYRPYKCRQDSSNDVPAVYGMLVFFLGLVTEGAWLPTSSYGSDEKTQADLGAWLEVGKTQVRSWDGRCRRDLILVRAVPGVSVTESVPMPLVYPFGLCGCAACPSLSGLGVLTIRIHNIKCQLLPC